MRFEAVHSFASLVRAGSYPAAAEELFLSPTTIHGHVKSIEEELGVTLVVFNGRKLELSRAGSRFFAFAEQMLAERAKLERDIRGLSRRDMGRIRIASLHGPSVYLLPPVIRAFHARHPDSKIAVTANGVGECEAALVSGLAEIAIINDLHINELSGEFEATTVSEDRMEMVVRADCYEPPDLKLLTRYPLALQPGTGVYRPIVEQWARRQGLTLEAPFEHTSFDGLLALAMQGSCIAMVGSYVARLSPYARHLRILDLPHFSFERKVVAMHSKRPDPLTAEFVRFLSEFDFSALRPFGFPE
ncbi:MAG TPA: LysR family transcriptional regulator [Dehalococcoidia bacterium]|nr:LysR family transcriptional regulator [Dehalococcoidia bacterium]